MQDKIIAGLLLAHGVLGGAWVVSVGYHSGFPLLFTVSNSVLAAAGIVSAVGIFRRQRWAVVLGLVFLAVQVFHIATPTFSFSFTLGLNAVVSAGWGSTVLGLNIIALSLFIWLLIRAVVAQQGSQADGPASGGSAA